MIKKLMTIGTLFFACIIVLQSVKCQVLSTNEALRAMSKNVYALTGRLQQLAENAVAIRDRSSLLAEQPLHMLIEQLDRSNDQLVAMHAILDPIITLAHRAHNMDIVRQHGAIMAEAQDVLTHGKSVREMAIFQLDNVYRNRGPVYLLQLQRGLTEHAYRMETLARQVKQLAHYVRRA